MHRKVGVANLDMEIISPVSPKDRLCKHAACYYGEIIDSLSVVVPTPHQLLPENEEIAAMPMEDLEGGWFLGLPPQMVVICKGNPRKISGKSIGW